MKSFFQSFLFLLFIASESNSFNVELIKDFQNLKNVRTTLILTCETTPDIITLVNHLQYTDTWIDLLDISNQTDVTQVDYQKFFMRLSFTHNVVCSLECHQSVRFFNELSKRKLFHSERSFLMFSKSLQGTFDLLSKQRINSDAEITVAVPDGRNEYHLYDVYNPSFERLGHLNITQIAHWNYARGVNVLHTQTKIERRRDFGGLTFQSVITIPKRIKDSTLLQYIDSIQDAYMDTIDRMNYHLFQLIMQMYNFKMFVRRAHIWARKEPNGTWLGAIGMANRSEVDIMISSLRWDNERYGVFDQTTGTNFVEFGLVYFILSTIGYNGRLSSLIFVFLHPRSVEASKVFLSPFEPTVWYSAVLVLLIIALGIRRSFIMEKIDVVQEELNEIGNDSSHSNCILMAVGFFFQQGYSGNPLLLSTRVFTTTVLVFSVIMYQFYGSFIVGSLLIESPKTLNTIQGLLNSDLRIYVDEVPYVIDNFKRVREKFALQLYNKVMAQNTIFMPLRKGLALVKHGGYAYHTDSLYAYRILKPMLTDSEICELQEIKYQEKLQCGPGVPRKSPLRELIKISLRKMQETGILAYHGKIWIGHKPKCENSGVHVVPVDMVHFSSALYVLIVGVQISFGFLIGEVLIERFLPLLQSDHQLNLKLRMPRRQSLHKTKVVQLGNR